MLKVSDIIDSMNRWAPPESISEGDNVGLIVGRKDAPVSCILSALEVNTAAIDEAIKIKADMIVCHHPIIFYPPLKKVTDEEHVSALVIRLIENGISVFSAHTNLDWATGGVCDVLANTVGLTNIKPMDNNEGRIGDIEPTTLLEFVSSVKEKLKSPAIKYVGAPNRIIKKVGLVSGSGGDYINQALKYGCDVFLSADFKYHQALMAEEICLSLIDAGHFETENGIIYAIANYLKKEYNNLTVVTSTRKKSYYNYI